MEKDTESDNHTISGIFIHYENGDMVNVNSLPKKEYEDFLELMNRVRLAYITLVVRS